MTTPININFYGNANFGPVTAALNALNQSVANLQKRMQSINALRLNPALTKGIQNVAAPKFDWDVGLQQADKMIKLLHKNKLAANTYGESLKNLRSISRQLAEEQVRIANSFAVKGKNGAWQMYVPAQSAVERLARTNEIFNRTLSIQGEMLGAIGTKIQNWGKNAQWAGRQLMVGWTIPFAAAAAATGFYAYQIDKQMVRVEKVYDGSQKGLRDMAMETSKAITDLMGTSTKDNLDVMAQMAAVGKTGVDLQRSTAEVQRLTTLGEMDRLQALQAVITLQSTFKMSTVETAEAINYMNAVENATSLSMADFAEALPRAAAPVAELGGSLQELGTIMVAMKERGIEAGEGANAIKTLMTRMLSPTREAQRLFQQLTGKDLVKFVESTGGKLMPTLAGLSEMIKNSNLSLLDQQKLVSELGGAYQATRLTSILQGLADGGGQVAKAMELAGASTEELANTAGKELTKQTESLSGQFDRALNTFLTEFEEFGQLGLRVATVLLQIGQSVMDFFNSMPDGLKTVIVLGASIAAVVGPLTMIVGLAGNLAGVFAKSIGGMLRWTGGFRSMTLEQRAAQLAADQFNKRILNQADMVQILVYQLDKLQRSYMGVQNAQGMVTFGPPGAQVNLKQNAHGAWQHVNPVTGQLGKHASNAQAQQATAIVKAQAGAARQLTQQTQKSTLAQKAFSQEAMLGVSAIAGMGTLLTDNNSKWDDILTTVTMVTAGVGLLSPVIEKMTGRMGAISKLGGVILGPWGMGIAAAGLAAFGIYQAVTAEADKQLDRQRALIESADGWAKSLGFVKAEVGQIRNAAGEVQDTMQSLVEKMKKDNAVVVDELRNLSGDTLMQRVRKEIYKLETQGISPDEIERGMEAALKAAGKTKSEIQKIMGDIKLKFDFGNTKNDLDSFLNDVKNDIASSMIKNGSYQGSKGFWDTATQVTERGMIGIRENAKIFYERLTQLDPAQQAYVISQMKTRWDDIQNNFLNDIKQKHPGVKKDMTWTQMLDQFTNFSPDEGFTNKIDSQLAIDIANSANAMREFAVAFGNLQGLSKENVLNLKTFNDILKYVDVGSMSAADAVKAYDDAIAKLQENGISLTDEQKKQIATMYASAAGLDAAKLAAGGYSKAQQNLSNVTDDIIRKMQLFTEALNAARGASTELWSSRATTNGFEMLGADPAAQTQALTNTVKGIYSGTMGTIYDVFGEQMEQQFNARMDAIAAGFKARRDALENESKNLDKSWETRMQTFQDQWQERMSSNEKAFKKRRKDIESAADAEEKAIEAQIDAIRKQEEVEREREEARKKQFEAEERRLERLNELANKSIDYNRALAEGNLDEAAKIQNNMASNISSWATEDALLAEQDKIDGKNKERELQIAALEERKRLIGEEKAARLEQLAAEEDALEESLKKQQEMEKRSLESQKELDRERLQNRIEALQEEQQSTENTEKAKQEMNKRTLEIELATLKAFVPKNEGELWAHIGKVQEAYSKHGIELTVKGGEWGEIIGNALQSNVDLARMEMSNDSAWANFGASVAAAITTGAFGMDLGSFFNMLVTGKPPTGWKPPGSTGVYTGGGGLQSRHAGGPVGPAGFNSRNGKKGNIQGDEVPTLLQRGEYVINRKAVSKLGPGYLNAVNSGRVPGGFGVGGADVGMAGVFGAMTGYMMGQLIKSTFLGSQKQQEAMASGTWSGSISQKPGVYGNAFLDEDQLRNANIIAKVGKSMGASHRDIVIALMTAMQESTLRNLHYGDRDSLGLFQQRPSQGWGSPAEVTNPEYAARKFFEGLFRVGNRDSMPLTLAAQAVQRSAYPYAYAQWESMAQALAKSGLGIEDGSLLGFGMFKDIMMSTSGGGGTGRYTKPVNGVVTSEYGMRWGSLHDGIDIGAPTGTPIFATDTGNVISAGWNNGGFGYWTLIDHGNGLISGYAHQNSISVRQGQKVGKGQVIGTVGTTGKSTGPHLHFQMGPGPGRFENPRNWIPSLRTGGQILYDDVLTNLHKNETVLTAPLSANLENGINNLDKSAGDTYDINVNINGAVAIGKDDIFDAVLEAVEMANVRKQKRLGMRR